MPRKLRSECLLCGKEPASSRYKYCSNACQREYEYRSFIGRWKAGELHGITSIGLVSGHIKRYLREKFENKCSECGWAAINSRTGLVPLVADHIDGNWRNNVESNLRLICPNCDSLTSTYAGLNRGNGRDGRAVSRRALEARSLLQVAPK